MAEGSLLPWGRVFKGLATVWARIPTVFPPPRLELVPLPMASPWEPHEASVLALVPYRTIQGIGGSALPATENWGGPEQLLPEDAPLGPGGRHLFRMLQHWQVRGGPQSPGLHCGEERAFLWTPPLCEKSGRDPLTGSWAVCVLGGGTGAGVQLQQDPGVPSGWMVLVRERERETRLGFAAGSGVALFFFLPSLSYPKLVHI